MLSFVFSALSHLTQSTLSSRPRSNLNFDDAKCSSLRFPSLIFSHRSTFPLQHHPDFCSTSSPTFISSSRKYHATDTGVTSHGALSRHCIYANRNCIPGNIFGTHSCRLKDFFIDVVATKPNNHVRCSLQRMALTSFVSVSSYWHTQDSWQRRCSGSAINTS